MAKGRSVEEKLAALDKLDIPLDTSSAVAVLLPFIADKSPRVVALAARLCAEKFLHDAIPALVDAFSRYMINGEKVDKNCLAKKALCKSLYELDYDNRSFYLQGSHYHQREPSWGGAVDTAADVRITCCQGLTLSRDPRIACDLLPRLYDEIASVRIGAVKAVSLLRPDFAEIILRQRALQGDEEPGVIGECFNSLLEVAPESAVDFVAGYLPAEDEMIIQEAAMALGIASTPETLAPIVEILGQQVIASQLAKYLVSGLALHRLPEAENVLMALIETNRLNLAEFTLEALHQYRNNRKTQDSLWQLLVDMGSPKLQEKYQTIWTD